MMTQRMTPISQFEPFVPQSPTAETATILLQMHDADHKSAIINNNTTPTTPKVANVPKAPKCCHKRQQTMGDSVGEMTGRGTMMARIAKLGSFAVSSFGFFECKVK